MTSQVPSRHIGIIGCGPAGLFMYKKIIESRQAGMTVTIFEKKKELGPGMPYSKEGACAEHVTNVSDNEVPEIVISIKEWVQTANPGLMEKYHINPENFNEWKVVPRLFFGEYLAAQFELLHKMAQEVGIKTIVLNNNVVTDIEDQPKYNTVKVITDDSSTYIFDSIVISTGHHWPKKFEGKVKNWFDSPYPPAKLAKKTNYPVAIKGASLTAIDAVRTLARENGKFLKGEDGKVVYTLHADCASFKIMMHSLHGLLPAIRFHLEDPHLSPRTSFSEEDLSTIMDLNDGFIPLDLIFEKNFKQPLASRHPDFYAEIKDLNIESFVEKMMSLRTRTNAFTLFKAEYAEAEKSIKRHHSVYWKEMLAVLSYAMNYPAKHLSAEDMLRLKKVLMPLISIIIAFVPQSSCKELMALHDAGVLDLIPVDTDSTVEPHGDNGAIYSYANETGEIQQVTYEMFIDAVGQPAFMYQDFPFEGLKKQQVASAAHLRFRIKETGASELAAGNKMVVPGDNANFYLKVPGVNINDHFQLLDQYGTFNNRIYIMAVPHIAGLNPDYSGLDFCETASARIVKLMFSNASVK